VTAETTSPSGLIAMQAMVARIACRCMTVPDLKAVSDSIDQAACLPARPQWEHKASAHTQVFGLLADATGYPVLARLAGPATAWVHDMTLTAGPAADGMILSSRRRLLGCLRARDPAGAGHEVEHHLAGLHYMCRLAAA
jgi:DNA-binding FadR family transcriptional regulator